MKRFNLYGESRLQIGVFNDGLAHLNAAGNPPHPHPDTDDESLWGWQLEHRLAPFWRELCGWAAAAAPGVRICLELHPGASAYNTASFLRLAAVGSGHGVEVWAEILGALRAAGYDGDVSIEHEDPRMGAEEGIEMSLAALRAAPSQAEVPVG